MEVHDILYIDVSRFESLASQRMFGLTQHKVVSEVVKKEKAALAGDVPKAVQEGGGHQTGFAREIRELDNSFREFLEAIGADVLEVSSDVEAARATCETALLGGQFVRAQGPFFYNDFAWLKNFSKLWAKGQDALHKLNAAKKEERAEFEQIKKNLDNTWAVADFGVGDAIECGVALGQPNDGILVKSLLNRQFLRTDSSSFIDTYGAKTHCKFNILGTVARVGWRGGVDLIDALSAGDGEGMQEFKRTIESTQEMALGIRRSASAGDKHSVYVMPLAVYRSSPLTVER